jgi:hypothetical protein
LSARSCWFRARKAKAIHRIDRIGDRISRMKKIRMKKNKERACDE